MIKIILGLLLVSMFTEHVLAKDSQHFNNLEDAAVQQAQIYQRGGKAKPIMSTDGMVRFAYGQSMPQLTCTPSRICDVEMEPGENIIDVALGDNINWKWSSAKSREKGKTILHVVIQPVDNSLETNAIIYTDKRSYHLKLVSLVKEGSYLNHVGFYYPDNMVAHLEEENVKDVKEDDHYAEGQVLDTSVNIENLDFDYRIDGVTNIKPKRVFNDGGRVYIEMPKSISVEESPILLILDENNKVQVVNYRVKNDMDGKKVHYVVDKLFSKAELRLGQEKARITWLKKDAGFFKRLGRSLGLVKD